MTLLYELYYAALTPAASLLIGVIGVVLAVALGFYQHKLNHFNRSRFRKSIERKIDDILFMTDMREQNSHNIPFILIGALAVILIVLGASSMTNTVVVVSSAAPEGSLKYIVQYGGFFLSVVAFYGGARRLRSLGDMYSHLLLPEKELKRIEQAINNSAGSSLLNEEDKREIGLQIAVARVRLSLLEKTSSPQQT